jgi:signal transduction histidine kinase/CheY-like chemotaxis protein
VLGAITFVAAESGRRYTDADLAAAEDLARRAAVAVENAHLYDALKEADKRKDEFLATLAHELRNPLAPIRNSAHLLRTAPVGSPAVERAREMIERQVHHLVRLVDDLLDVSRVMRGKIELRPERLDVAAVAARSVEITQPLMESRSVQLTVSKPDGAVWVAADPVRLAQVIDNLLTNAAKYTNPGGRVHLTVEPASDGREVVVRVQDTGIGIAPDKLEKVFELFFQVDTTAGRSQGGLGLGLTLVKSLVEMHGGSVQAHSAGLGKGSEFVVRLPTVRRGENGRRDDSDSTAPADQASSRRVLVVDDHADAADSLAMLLTMEGHQVRVAHNGPAAVEAVRADPPDVVLLDLGMPGMDGYEVARRLKEGLAPPDLLIVALTGWGQDEDRRRTREAGFHHHFVKPVDPNDLRQLLARTKPVRTGEKSPPPTGRESRGSSQ